MIGVLLKKMAQNSICEIILIYRFFFFPARVFLFERELVNTDGITRSIMTEWVRGVSLVASLRLNNRSTAVFKKLITFLGSRKG